MAEPADSGRVSPAIDAEREALLKTLVAHGVQFVVIGGAGIQSHGRRYDTLDIDLALDRDEANLHRLADALKVRLLLEDFLELARPACAAASDR
jgi:hypothetical protein